MKKESRIISLIVGGTLFMEMLDTTAISTALPKMAHDFESNVVHLSAGITSYTVMLAVFIPISGWIADRYGAKKVFNTAIIGFILSSIACGLSTNLTSFVIARICQGTAGALMVPVGRLIVLKHTAKKDLVDAIGYIAWAGLLGPIVGPVLGGFLRPILAGTGSSLSTYPSAYLRCGPCIHLSRQWNLKIAVHLISSVF